MVSGKSGLNHFGALFLRTIFTTLAGFMLFAAFLFMPANDITSKDRF
jgi:hypothetical protein